MFPKRDASYKDILLPRRVNENTAKEEPKWKKSLTERQEPIRQIPKIDNADPSRVNDVTLIEEPKLAWSLIENTSQRKSASPLTFTPPANFVLSFTLMVDPK